MAKDVASEGQNIPPRAEHIVEFVKRIESLDADRETEKAESRNRCKVFADDIKAVYDEAREVGITTKSLKAKVKINKLEKQVEKIRTGLEDDQYTMLEIIEEALAAS